MADMTSGRVDQRRVRGERARADILDVAVDTASRVGLDGLTLSVLADAVEMSKSGVVRHFGSRENLQLAAVQRASEVFAERVMGPARDMPAGLSRLRRVVGAWIDYLVGDVFSGGCFFYAAAAELDRRPGPLRDAVAGAVRAGLSAVRADLEAAVAAGDLAADADLDQVLFELHGVLQEVSTAHLLLEDRLADKRGWRAIDDLLRRYER